MSLSYEQALAEARAMGEGALINAVVATNQDNGIVSYMSGQLIYHPSHFLGHFPLPEALSTPADKPLIAQFSDRTFLVGNPPQNTNPPTLDVRPQQNFSIMAEDKIGVSISKAFGNAGVLAHFILQNWGNAQYSIVLQPIGDLLYGLGAPIGNNTFQALYTIAFISVNKPVQPPH